MKNYYPFFFLCQARPIAQFLSSKVFFLSMAFASAQVSSYCQEITFSQHIAPIIYQHCTPCHRPGEIAPFPLTNYDQVRAWSGMIAFVTGIRYMPPWKPEVGYQHYQKENYLTDAEIKLIDDWVTQGSPRGNVGEEPALPIFPTGSQIGKPDLVVSFAQSYKHVGNNVDEYRYFVIPTGLTEDKDLVALEIRPGNKKIVHHCLVWEDTTGASALEDAKSAEYGFVGGQLTTLNSLNGQLPGYVPGQKPVLYTNGIAQKLHAGADLKLQVHYAPSASDQYDSTTINLFFAERPATRYLQSHVMIPFFGTLTNGPFVIPANQTKEFHGVLTVPEDVSMVGIAPHSHLLGRRWEVFAVTPSMDTINLIRIPEWDFNWQGAYYFKKLIKIPKNSVVHAYAQYDNTTENINNPHNPPQRITWGEKTSDEMFYLPLIYLSYQPGDENIEFEDLATAVQDPSRFYSVKDELYPILTPNPTAERVNIGFTLAAGSPVTLKLVSANGTVIKTWMQHQFHLAGWHSVELDLGGLPQGIYLVVMETGKVRMAKQLAINY